MASFRCRPPAPAWRPFTGAGRGGEPRSTFRIMPYLLPLFVLMPAEDFARSTGDLPPALGSVRPA